MKFGLPLWLCLVAVVPQQAPPPPASTVLTSAVLLGQVVDAETGDPVEDASVTLTGRPVPARGRGAPPASDGNIFELMMARSDRGGAERVAASSNGRFVFRTLPVALYTVRAEAPGYLNGSAGLLRPGGFASVEIREGQTSARVSVRLWKQAVLTGVVVDEAGEPVIGASVTAYRREINRFGTLSYDSSRPATTDDRGVYRLSGLRPGDHLVAVPQSQSTAPAAAADAFMQGLLSGQMPEGGLGSLGRGASPMDPRAVRVGEWRLTSDNVQSPAGGDGAAQAYRTVFFPSATSPVDASFVSLRSGEERSGVDFTLRPVITGRISGVVTGPKGAVGAIPIRLVPVGDRRAGEPSLLEVATGLTSADGRFMLLAVPPGQYRVIAEREGPPDMSDMPEELASNPMFQMAMKMQGGARPPMYGETTVTLAPGDTGDVAITVTGGVTLAGRLATQDGPMPAKAGVTRATITLRSLDGGGDSPRFVRTDAEGKFTASGVMPGRYAVAGTMVTEGASWLVAGVEAAGRDVTDSALVVEDKDVSGIIVMLTSRVGIVRGTVRRDTVGPGAATGTPPTLTAVAVPSNFMNWTDPRLIADRVHFDSVSPDYAFRIGPMLPGEYLIAVVDEAQLDLSGGLAALRRLAAQATRVTVSPGPGQGNTVMLSVVSVRR